MWQKNICSECTRRVCGEREAFVRGRIRAVALLALALLLQLSLPLGAVRAGIATPAGQIAYQGTDGKLHIVGADGGGDRIVATRGNALAPRWSPDGTAIVYYDEQPGGPAQGQLVVVNPATGAARVLVAPQLRDPDLGTYWSYLQPRWSADGRYVYYLLSGGSRTTTIMRVAAGGGTPEELFYGVGTAHFDLSPADGRIALTDDAFSEEPAQGSRLVVIAPDGTGLRTVLPRSGVYYYQPTWAPDGRSIAVRRQFNPTSATSSLVLINPDTGEERTLGTLPGGSTYSFSPDGHWLVYATADARRLAVVNLGDFADQRPLGDGVTPAWAPWGDRFFPETGYSVGGRFLAYWESHGGLAINGYPISPERAEVLEDGRTYRVQWFERVRLEYHPENPAPYDVLLGQFGRLLHPADPPATAQPGARFFAETGHNLTGRFLTYWEAHGGLPQFGFPLTETITETLEDGTAYEVQYFERARFEYHPDNPEPYRILLGQFGRRILATR
jgi:dipeptidyl aminopeptidase/acylaminoacyl peptidase